MSINIQLPPQQLPFNKKGKEWRKKVIDWADNRTFTNHSLVRKSIKHKKINYDLINGNLHMEDLNMVLNPENIQSGFIPDKIKHYPIINSKLNVLRGEESKRPFEFTVRITNPNAISEIENTKRDLLLENIKSSLENSAQSEEEFNEELEKLNKYYNYNWQDLREIRTNAILNHYIKEYNIPLLFNKGFMDAIIVGEEIYQCDIISGEPVIEKLDPLKVRIFKSGFSNKIEDADIITIEDYWSPGRIIDTFYESLTDKDIKYLEECNNPGYTDDNGDIDERDGFVLSSFINEEEIIENLFSSSNNELSSSPYDIHGNIKVLRVYWKSRRKIKKVKSYNPITGEEEYGFYPETYIINKELGEEEEIFYINEAWEGTKIGEKIYVNMRPRPIQYNRLYNPSRCHFGIIGSIYNINDDKPFSLVDMMKPYNYLYNAVHDRLNKMLAKNWGKIIRLDLAKVPKGWDVEKWLFYAKSMGITVEDSFKEGNIGAATGKIVGALNNASSGVIDAEFGNSIASQINLLEFIKSEMSEVAGITRQREGQISNRETVGGVERATLQSSHITEWLFMHHDDVKKRALECFLETAKIALKGKNKKFQYLLHDTTLKIMDIDGDEFAESDYGLIVDNSNSSELNQKLDMLAQAALQNQSLSFSSIMALYGSSSLAEKQRMIEEDERVIKEERSKEYQANLQSQKELADLNRQMKELELKIQEEANIRDNETKLAIKELEISNKNIDNLEEDKRQFDIKHQFEKVKFDFDKYIEENRLKLEERRINNGKNTST